jgi:hypothetical protein
MNESYAVPRMRGALISISENMNNSSGTTVKTYAVTTTRTHDFSSVTRSLVPFHGSRLASVGLMRANMSGTPVRSLTM